MTAARGAGPEAGACRATHRGPRPPTLWHLTFTQIYADERIFWTIGPAWSLAVEIHFYVLLAPRGAGLAAAGSAWRRELVSPCWWAAPLC